MAVPSGEFEAWRKSSTSGDCGCVEVQIAAKNVYVRDTKNRDAGVLKFTHQEWTAFVTGVHLGEFDVPVVDQES